MATVFTHPALALAAAPWFRGSGVGRREVIAGAVLTVLPDLDVLGMALGIPYAHVLGHRGLSHSLLFAVLMSGGLVWWRYPGHRRRGRLWLYFFLCAASHGLLDALTNGGLGVAFFAPLDNQRYFFPLRPIEVSPIGLGAFASARGVAVLYNELWWVWAPASLIGIAGVLVNRLRKSRQL